MAARTLPGARGVSWKPKMLPNAMPKHFVAWRKAPKCSTPATAQTALFDAGGDRPDKGDRGGEYRSLVGLPGGESSPLAGVVAKALEGKGLKLARGSGDDGDTLGTGKVWLYDTAAFPFYQAEGYHQFHDGFAPGENYPNSYNDLGKGPIKLVDTTCPSF